MKRMHGRKDTSKKWTAFPAEYVEQIQNVFAESFGRELRGAKLLVEGRIFSEEIVLRVGFREGSSLRQNNFEISTDFNSAKENAIETIYACIDGAAALLASFFESDSHENLPIAWKAFKFENKTLYFQYSTVNSDLENEADRLLGVTGETGLYNEFDDETPDNDPPGNLH